MALDPGDELTRRPELACRVVGIGEEHHTGALAYLGEDFIDIGGVGLLGRHHGLGARAERRDGVDQKAMRGVDRLVAIAQIRVGD